MHHSKSQKEVGVFYYYDDDDDDDDDYYYWKFKNKPKIRDEVKCYVNLWRFLFIS